MVKAIASSKQGFSWLCLIFFRLRKRRPEKLNEIRTQGKGRLRKRAEENNSDKNLSKGENNKTKCNFILELNWTKKILESTSRSDCFYFCLSWPEPRILDIWGVCLLDVSHRNLIIRTHFPLYYLLMAANGLEKSKSWSVIEKKEWKKTIPERKKAVRIWLYYLHLEQKNAINSLKYRSLYVPVNARVEFSLNLQPLLNNEM